MLNKLFKVPTNRTHSARVILTAVIIALSLVWASQTYATISRRNAPDVNSATLWRYDYDKDGDIDVDDVDILAGQLAGVTSFLKGHDGCLLVDGRPCR